MTLPLVSVNVTTFNRSSLLLRAINSIISQDYLNYEIIIVDDCSTDSTSDVIKNFNHPSIKYYKHPTNLGNAASRNTAFRHSQGEYIAFMDDDDEWIDTNKLTQQINFLESHPSYSLSCTSVITMNQSGHVGYKQLPESFSPCSILKRNGVIYSPSVVVRRSLIESTGGFDTLLSRGVDSDFYRCSIIKHNARLHFHKSFTTLIYEDTNRSRLTLSPSNFSSLLKFSFSCIYPIFKYPVSYLQHPSALIHRIKMCIHGLLR